MNTRRTFLKGASGTMALSLLGSGFTSANDSHMSPTASQESFKQGIAGYSFVHFKLDEALDMMRKTDLHYLCIKDFHLPLASTPEQIAAFHAKLKESDVTGYAVGPIYMKNREAIDQAFDYAKRVGVDLIVGIPNPEDLPYVDQKVKEYNIRYAIHNHGPGDKLYPNADTLHGHIKDLDARVGMCFDIGHNMRYGNDPLADFQKYSRRIFDMHLKNVTSATHDGKTCELGRGVINIPALVKVLRKVKYSGVCALEYEKDMKEPLHGIAESMGYFRGVLEASRKS
ncbi:sugar phosphate isomerase/epimerase family protein [Arundinibacter roseus]|uniref:Sugar phosphate isomerase/epimerase n=1 Tax=Arundinibacter roseus TaxID=2070510 RepID=A0A4R4JY65_9BACT|nr:sugar phosphate isomerase/epimerase family protein [Arundinibacter roseus]TDB59830.1 sugar phosphate isomerase/epimerase [Arundinibacter roseus]